MTRSLRPYQSASRALVSHHWRTGARGVVLALPTGAGKTFTAASITQRAIERGARVLWLAHLDLLLGQAEDTARDAGMDSATIRGGCWGSSAVPLHIASMGTIGRRLSDARLTIAPDIIVVDECFPAGTDVGGRRIETIRIGDTVPAFDARGRIVRGRVTHTFRSRPSALVAVHAGGHRVVCTPGHPFFTRAGWKPAAALTEGEEVLRHELRVPVRPMRNDDRSALPHEPSSPSGLLPPLCRSEERGAEGSVGRGVQLVQGDCHAGRQADLTVACDRPSVLRAGVLQSLLGGGEPPHAGGVQPQARFGSHEEAQPDAPQGEQGEDGRHSPSDRTHAATPRWQRPDDGAAAPACEGTRDGDGGGDPHWQAPGERLSDLLQGRHRGPEHQAGDRSRRRQPRIPEGAGFRPEAGRALAWARVDGVEVQEPGGDGTFGGLCPDGHVYNLEVEEHHTYVAAGFVVHNCHRAMCATYQQILDRWPAAHVLGLTATPWRTDGKGLGSSFQQLVAPIAPEELVESGHLVRIKARAPRVPDMGKARTRDGDYSRAAAEKAMAPGLGDVIRGIVEACAERPGMRLAVFAASIRHSQVIVDELNARGVPAAHVDGKTPSEVRTDLLGKEGRIASGDVQVVSSVGVLDEGVDCPTLDAVVLASPTASSARFLQRVGRGLRPAPGKTHCLLLDYGGCLQKHWWPTDDVRRFYDLEGGAPERAGATEARPMPIRTCKSCFAVYGGPAWAQGAPCPSCGWVEPAPKVEVKDKGTEMGEVTRAQVVAWGVKAQAWQALADEARARGYKPMWALLKFKGRFGHPPSKAMLAELRGGRGGGRRAS